MTNPLNFLPASKTKRKWASILITVALAAVLSAWGIYVINTYGLALFLLTPFFMGMSTAVLYGYKREVSKTDVWIVGMVSLGIFCAGLLAFGMEGLVCVAMALPPGIISLSIGSVAGYAIIKKTPGAATTTLLILIAAIPTTAFMEKDAAPEVYAVVTSIEINADSKTVWKNVIAFPQLKEPDEFIFKTGIAYPINATIDGEGVGAVRHCNFTTGSFVEPITVWDEPNMLQFDVLEQPHPLKELSFWDVDAPHLHNYFESKQGQFQLQSLDNGNTLLRGTTWYNNDIKPAFYWSMWSDYIVHKIHWRVLEHIKEVSEKND